MCHSVGETNQDDGQGGDSGTVAAVVARTLAWGQRATLTQLWALPLPTPPTFTLRGPFSEQHQFPRGSLDIFLSLTSCIPSRSLDDCTP